MAKHLSTMIKESSPEVRWYFSHLEALLERFPESIALVFLFSRVEEAQNMTIYMGMRKLHGVNANFARAAVDRHRMQRPEFRDFFKKIIGKNLTEDMTRDIQFAESVRDRLVHGKEPPNKDIREAVRSVIRYAEAFNQELYPVLDVKPFGKRTGFTGAGQPLDRKTSGWVIKGMGL